MDADPESFDPGSGILDRKNRIQDKLQRSATLPTPPTKLRHKRWLTVAGGYKEMSSIFVDQ